MKQDLFDTETCAFSLSGAEISCRLEHGDFVSEGTIENCDDGVDASAAWFISRLRGNEPKWKTEDRGSARVLDLFSGCGGLPFGVREAARAALLTLMRS